MDMLLELLSSVHDFVLLMLLLVLPVLFPSDVSIHSFPRVNISWYVSKGYSKTSSSNQILHLANPHDKLSTFVLYPCHGFPSIYQLNLWDPRLRHLSLSLLSYVGRRIRDGEHEL
jgi:hypothetical protein